MKYNITPATDNANWLYISEINRFVNDFTQVPARLTIVLRGAVRELCPAGWLLGSGGAMVCEYTLLGAQSNNTCCPHGVTHLQADGKDSGCRADLDGAPYRLGNQVRASQDNQTLFNFDLTKVDKPNGAGSNVNCTEMSIRTISFAVRADVEIDDVTFNGYNYTWQLEPYTNNLNWLNILDIGYGAADLPLDAPVPLQILVKGNSTTYLCPSFCEYVIYGAVGLDQCCPTGLTNWTTSAASG